MDLPAIQSALREQRLDGWLFFDFRGSDPLAARILGLDAAFKKSGAHTTRRWFYFIPATGAPRKLNHAIEPAALDSLPGERRIYSRFSGLADELGAMLKGAKKVAMQYSPLGAIPYLARVDAGTVELVRAQGIEVVSSGELVMRFEALLNAAQLASHERAAGHLRAVVDETFAEVARRLRDGVRFTECDIQGFMMTRFGERGLETDHPPIVALDAHAADPHFAPRREKDFAFGKNRLLLIDLWGREADGVYGDITWTAWTGPGPVPDELRAIFEATLAGRDAGLAACERAARARAPITGGTVDDATRGEIVKRGYGDFFIHRTGHSIKFEVHANGANIDNYENPDARRLLPGCLFSIEPGIYLPGRYGVRSEIDVYFGEECARATGQPIQRALDSLLG